MRTPIQLSRPTVQPATVYLLAILLPAALLGCSEAADGTSTTAAAAQTSAGGTTASGTTTTTVSGDTAMTISPQNPTVAVTSVTNFAVTGGTSPYTYVISSGAGTLTDVTDSSGTVISANYAAGSSAGTAEIQVTDSLGSTVTTTVTVGAAAGTFQISPLNPTIAAGASQVFSTVNGTGPYYFYVSSGTDGSFSTDSYTAPSTAGTYTVYVEDQSNSAIATTTVTVTSASSGTGGGTATTYSSVISTTYTTLASYQSGCKSSTPISDGCYSAIYRYCRANGYASGFGPVETSGNIVTLVCMASGVGAGADVLTSYSSLASYDSSCVSSNPVSLACNYAVDRLCQASGYVSGYGPEEHTGGSSATVGCVSSSAGVAMTSTFAEMQIYHSECTTSDPHGTGCSAAINRYCAANGYVSGFGFQWYSGSTVAFVCTH